VKHNRRRLLWIATLLCVGGLAGRRGFEWWHEHRHDQVILAAAQRYGVEPALVKAVVWRESRFQASARGRSGEFGLMQIREDAALEWVQAERVDSFVPEHLFDPATNTLAGTWYLRKCLRRFGHTDNPVPYALAAYNAGPAQALRWGTGPAATNSAAFMAQIGFPMTQRYVRAVVGRRDHYRGRI
jgi:soluble lytic murein transglycosylase